MWLIIECASLVFHFPLPKEVNVWVCWGYSSLDEPPSVKDGSIKAYSLLRESMILKRIAHKNSQKIVDLFSQGGPLNTFRVAVHPCIFSNFPSLHLLQLILFFWCWGWARGIFTITPYDLQYARNLAITPNLFVSVAATTSTTIHNIYRQNTPDDLLMDVMTDLHSTLSFFCFP